MFTSYLRGVGITQSLRVHLRCLPLFLSLVPSRYVLSLARNYTRKVNPDMLTLENETSSEPVECEKTKKRRKPTRKTSKTSDKNDTASVPAEVQEAAGIFPFEGTLTYPETSCTPNTSTLLHNSENIANTFTVHIGNATDGSDARTYFIHKDGERFHLPSVTTILSRTVPKQRGFMLSNWRKGLVKEFGEAGYLQVKDQIKALGSRFHAVSGEGGKEGGREVEYSLCMVVLYSL